MTCESALSCLRCHAGIKEFLRTDLPVAPKIMSVRQAEMTAKASGDGLLYRGVQHMVDGSVVDWDEDGSNIRPGPNAIHYDTSRIECGAHFLYNAFWQSSTFVFTGCCHATACTPLTWELSFD
jgi:hypothetical protein